MENCVCAQSCPTLCDLMILAFQAPLFMEFSRQEYWSRFQFPSPGELPYPGIERRSPALQPDDLPTELCRKLYIDSCSMDSLINGSVVKSLDRNWCCRCHMGILLLPLLSPALKQKLWER